ncbi:hypothetical protein [Virgibacillus halodenitrificans]|nr:hypothetical protein [Virgibacillus halodenitrificans]CDQ31372.1 hypothetical protein BN993_00747 [Virgibacillus halodenitrificans]
MSSATYINLYWVNLNENFEEEQKEYVSSYELDPDLDRNVIGKCL